MRTFKICWLVVMLLFVSVTPAFAQSPGPSCAFQFSDLVENYVDVTTTIGGPAQEGTLSWPGNSIKIGRDWSGRIYFDYAYGPYQWISMSVPGYSCPTAEFTIEAWVVDGGGSGGGSPIRNAPPGRPEVSWMGIRMVAEDLYNASHLTTDLAGASLALKSVNIDGVEYFYLEVYGIRPERLQPGQVFYIYGPDGFELPVCIQDPFNPDKMGIAVTDFDQEKAVLGEYSCSL